MHLPIEVIRQSSIVIQSTQIRPADVTDLKFLMPRRTRGVGKGFQLSFFFLFGGFGGADFVELLDGEVYRSRFAKDGYFKKTGVYSARVVGDLLQLFRNQGPALRL